MAFDIRNLSEVRALGNGRWHWHYFTTDSLATCLAADYFSTTNGLSRLHRGDVLEIVASTAAESQQVTISSVANSSVTLLQSSAGAATDSTARTAAAAAQATADAAVSKAGGTMTGALVVPAATLTTQAPTLAQATDLVGAYPVNGLVFAGTGETQLANALASGHKSLFFPEGLALTVTSAKTVPAGVKLELKKGSSITVTGTNITALLVGGDDVEISGEGSIVCCGTSGSYSAYNGAAISATTSRARVRISGISISNHRGWGIIGIDVADWTIEGVRATLANAPVTPDQTSMFADIGLIGATQDCTIRGCKLRSGQAFPILIQTVAGTAVSVFGNLVEDNVVSGALGHGISLYGQNLINTSGSQVQGTGQDTWYGNIVKGSRVYNTLGSLFNTGASNYPFGTGIYIQGASGTIVANNQVYGAAVNTVAETLAPAGIGVVNCRDWTVQGNHVQGSTWYGLYYNNANDGGTIGQQGISTVNKASGSTKAGFKIISCQDVLSVGDVSELNTTYGWELRDSIAKGNYSFKGCIARKNTLDGFATIGSAIPKVSFEACEADSQGQHGFGIQNSTVSRLYIGPGCKARSNASRGYSIGTGMTIDEWERPYYLSNGSANLISTALPANGRHYGTATPEAALLAAVGCQFIRTDGGAATCLYIKESGAGTNSGWVGK